MKKRAVCQCVGKAANHSRCRRLVNIPTSKQNYPLCATHFNIWRWTLRTVVPHLLEYIQQACCQQIINKQQISTVVEEIYSLLPFEQPVSPLTYEHLCQLDDSELEQIIPELAALLQTLTQPHGVKEKIVTAADTIRWKALLKQLYPEYIRTVVYPAQLKRIQVFCQTKDTNNIPTFYKYMWKPYSKPKKAKFTL